MEEYSLSPTSMDFEKRPSLKKRDSIKEMEDNENEVILQQNNNLDLSNLNNSDNNITDVVDIECNDRIISNSMNSGYFKGKDNFFELLIHIFVAYVNKFKGVPMRKRPKRQDHFNMFVNMVFSFIGVLLLSVIDRFYLSITFKLNQVDGTFVKLLTSAFGATALLIFSLYESPTSQPRNVILGHLLSSFIGVSVRYACGGITSPFVPLWIQGPIAVCASIFFMDFFECIHPPGSATALIAIMGGDPIEDLGFGYILTASGAAVFMVIVAIIINNIMPDRQYPVYWW